MLALTSTAVLLRPDRSVLKRHFPQDTNLSLHLIFLDNIILHGLVQKVLNLAGSLRLSYIEFGHQALRSFRKTFWFFNQFPYSSSYRGQAEVLPFFKVHHHLVVIQFTVQNLFVSFVFSHLNIAIATVKHM